MKKLLLSFTAVLFALSLNAQSCTPGVNFQDSTFGVWPDTLVNFPQAAANVFYSADLNFRAPVNSADVDPTIVGGTIDEFTVTAVSGLPPGMTYACNISNCTYAGGDNGCANVYGTEATQGTYDVIISITAQVTFPIIGQIPYDYDFSGYKINVGGAGVATLLAPEFSVYPNPAIGYVTLNGLQGIDVAAINIVSMSGSTVKSFNNVNSSSYAMNVEDLDEGMYFVQINHDGITDVVKFVKK